MSNEMSNERIHKDEKVTRYTHLLEIYLSNLSECQIHWSHLDKPKSVKRGRYAGLKVENRW